MHDLTTIQRMNAEATEQAMTQLAEEQVLADIDAERAEAVAQKFNDWRDTIDLEVVRKWYLFIPGGGTPFNEIVDTYDGMRSLLLTYYVDPYDIITVPGEIDE